MKTAIIKFPFKLQDLIIIESTRLFVDPNIAVIPVDFSTAGNDYTGADIVLGLGKEASHANGFVISKCRMFNTRDIEYLDHLRFSNHLNGSKCVKLKNVITALRTASLSGSDKKSGLGVYSIADIYSLMEVYTGYENDIKKEYEKKSFILREWIKEMADGSKAESLTEGKLKELLYTNLNSIMNLSLNDLDEFGDIPSSDSRPSRLIKEIDRECKYFYSNTVNTCHRSNIYNFLNTSNCNFWVRNWLEARIEASNRKSKYVDLWNSCDFMRPASAINTTGILIPNWKELARDEEDIVFFLTPESGSDNWSIISLKPTDFPMVESSIPYWTHVSKFLAKCDSLDKAKEYLDVLLETYKNTLPN